MVSESLLFVFRRMSSRFQLTASTVSDGKCCQCWRSWRSNQQMGEPLTQQQTHLAHQQKFQ